MNDLKSEQRFLDKVHKTNSCWLWQASLDKDGYGKFTVTHQKWVRAHRWSYEHFVGPIPEGLTIDHLCRVRNCVNPEHLEPVTIQVNIARSVHKEVAFCKYGHEYTPENTRKQKSGKACIACEKVRTKRRAAAGEWRTEEYRNKRRAVSLGGGTERLEI